MATLSEMQSFVRVHADADVEDAPNETLEVYARIAYNDILSRRNGWPHLMVEGELLTVPNQDTYDLSAVTGVTTSLDLVLSVMDQNTLGRRLVFMTQSDADIAFGTPVSISNEIATAYTIVGSNIILYPKPSTARTYKVRGVRVAATWPNGAGSSPDLPAELHDAISWYMLSSYFMAQEDTQLAGVYMGEYEKMVDRFMKNQTTKEFSQRVAVIGGQNYRQPSFGRWVRGMVE